MADTPNCDFCHQPMTESSGGGFWVCEYDDCPGRETKMSEQPFKAEDVVLQFVTAPMDETKRMAANIALEYVVVKYPDAPWGITVYGRFGGYSERTWMTPWHVMPLIAELLRRLAEAEAENKVLRHIPQGETWYWQGDGTDFPESLTCPVIMTADVLRNMLARLAEAEQERDGLAAELKEADDMAVVGTKVTEDQMDKALEIIEKRADDYAALAAKLKEAEGENKRLRERAEMTEHERRAYQWALEQQHTSVSTSHARTLALFIRKALVPAPAGEKGEAQFIDLPHARNRAEANTLVWCLKCGAHTDYEFAYEHHWGVNVNDKTECLCPKCRKTAGGGGEEQVQCIDCGAIVGASQVIWLDAEPHCNRCVPAGEAQP